MKKNGAGKRRHRITLESPGTTQNTANGEKTITWTDQGSVWASINPISGREILIAKSFDAETTHVINILYRSDINPTWRITYQGRIFGIDGILTPDEIKYEQNLYCTE